MKKSFIRIQGEGGTNMWAINPEHYNELLHNKRRRSSNTATGSGTSPPSSNNTIMASALENSKERPQSIAAAIVLPNLVQHAKTSLDELPAAGGAFPTIPIDAFVRTTACTAVVAPNTPAYALSTHVVPGSPATGRKRGSPSSNNKVPRSPRTPRTPRVTKKQLKLQRKAEEQVQESEQEVRHRKMHRKLKQKESNEIEGKNLGAPEVDVFDFCEDDEHGSDHLVDVMSIVGAPEHGGTAAGSVVDLGSENSLHHISNSSHLSTAHGFNLHALLSARTPTPTPVSLGGSMAHNAPISLSSVPTIEQLLASDMMHSSLRGRMDDLWLLGTHRSPSPGLFLNPPASALLRGSSGSGSGGLMGLAGAGNAMGGVGGGPAGFGNHGTHGSGAQTMNVSNIGSTSMYMGTGGAAMGMMNTTASAAYAPNNFVSLCSANATHRTINSNTPDLNDPRNLLADTWLSLDYGLNC